MVDISEGLAGMGDDDREEPFLERSLVELVDATRDGVEGYDAAMGEVDSAEIKAAFRELRSEREEMLAEVTEVAVKHGLRAEEATDGTVGGALHRTWLKLKGALTAGDEAILDAVVDGERQVARSYDEVLSGGIPDEVESVARKGRTQIAEAIERLESLSA